MTKVWFSLLLALSSLMWGASAAFAKETLDLIVLETLPVPIVVGMATNGFKSPGTGVPLPIGAFTYSRKSAGYVE